MIDDKDPSVRDVFAKLQRQVLRLMETMMNSPKKGEPYQVCTHLAAPTDRPGLHYWRVAGRDPWIVLCERCHASASAQGSVEIHGETFELAADVPIVPGSSCVHHSTRVDVVADKPPPAGEKPPKSPARQVLNFRPKDSVPAWFPIAERVFSVVASLVEGMQTQAHARAEIKLRHKEIEVRATECMIRTLETNAATIERLQETAIQSQAAMAEKIQCLEKQLLLHNLRVNRTASDSKTPSSGASRRRS